MQTYFDVRHKGGRLNGLKSNLVPLRRERAEKLAEQIRRDDA